MSHNRSQKTARPTRLSLPEMEEEEEEEVAKNITYYHIIVRLWMLTQEPKREKCCWSHIRYKIDLKLLWAELCNICSATYYYV